MNITLNTLKTFSKLIKNGRVKVQIQADSYTEKLYSCWTQSILKRQQFLYSFCTDFLSTKNYQHKPRSKEKLDKTLLYEKTACKMLVKLTPGANPIKLSFFGNEELFRFLLISVVIL